MRIILASASPRRRELLSQILPEFDVIPSEVEEVITKEEPGEIAIELAAEKALAVAEQVISSGGSAHDDTEDTGEFTLYGADDTLVIGADTIVVHRGKILGKPRDKMDAYNTLTELANDTHEVYTGVCLLYVKPDGRSMQYPFYERTDVTFYPMKGEEIAEYVASGDPMDKAGSYGIQSGCAKYIRGISGDYNNVVGLPLARLYQELRELRIVKAFT